jgi:hypothetical protein
MTSMTFVHGRGRGAVQQPSRQGEGGIDLLVCGIVAGPLFFFSLRSSP